ncbi:hypothetical protein Harman_31980 [Haloarcula mannanilytica]|uniref:Methyltransferase type 11 domain-containing protein n=1 Tax=Haloarcula mannanilytica TaxID=2509225 RepID=A0A4C2ERP2_9EURY|nr:class I SAM-dependent methyltransferase [Haloarcula mannanilytica]GCF15263.1 hypothetical protein Harman_31980 [Haloarcula mannanilytica]
MTGSELSADDIKEEVRTYWNERAETYDDDSHHALHGEDQHEAWLSVLDSWTADPPQRTLDVGCGTGVISFLLSELGHDVTGVDYSVEMLEKAREKGSEKDAAPNFRVGDAEALEQPDNTYDMVTSRHLIWTLPSPAQAIEEWCRVVRPGGRLILIEGHWDFTGAFDGYEDIHEDLPLYDGRPPEELSELLSKHGVENVESEPLMDTVFWGEEPDYQQYIIGGDIPG